MAKKAEPFRFDGKMAEFEKTLLDYHLERAKFNHQSETLATLFAYLSIYEQLTQTQLRELTGYSKSTISTGLANLINIRYVKKEKKRNSREFIYSIAFPSSESIDDVLGTMSKEIIFFKKKIGDLSKNVNPSKKGYEFLLKRLKEAVKAFELYQSILEYVKLPEETRSKQFEFNEKSRDQSGLKMQDFKSLKNDYDPEVKQIEDEIIDFFLYESAYSTLEEFTLIVYVYFLTRKILTQEKIRDLTGLSYGKVSEVVNALLEKKYIQKLDKSKHKNSLDDRFERQYLYAMPSIYRSFFESGINSFEDIIKWEENFKEIKKTLIQEKSHLQKLIGYDQVLQNAEQYLEVIPKYREVKQIFEKII